MKKLLPLLLILPLLAACVDEDDYDNTPQGNFNALWTIIDQKYCFFPQKEAEGLDWDEIYSRYNAYITPDLSDQQLFELCANMLAELEDGHVNLTSAFNTARYWDWFEDYATNFDDSLQQLYLGTDYRLSSGLKYTILSDNIGYIYCSSFDYSFGSGNLSAMMSYLALCDGLIVDIRSNSGGMLTSATDLAGCFTNTEITGAYISHKTGTAHDAFSSPTAIKISPAEGLRWQKPVVVLTNRSSYSAANTFAALMQACGAILVGDKTGGGAGFPFKSELPNGWTVRLSVSPIYNTALESIENGITPDVAAAIADDDRLLSRDSMIEAAIATLKANQ